MQVRLVGARGRRVLARDVLIFRVDSIDGDMVGQAILFKDWQVLG